MRCSHAFLMRFFDERTERAYVCDDDDLCTSLRLHSHVYIDENRASKSVNDELMLFFCCVKSSSFFSLLLTFNCRTAR